MLMFNICLTQILYENNVGPMYLQFFRSSHGLWLFFGYTFYFRLNQVIPTFINHSQLFIPDEICLIFFTSLRGKWSQTYPYLLSTKQGCIWYQFYNVFGMLRLGIEPHTSCPRGKRSTTEPPLNCALGSMQPISIPFLYV